MSIGKVTTVVTSGQTDGGCGLTTREAKERLAKVGPNEQAPARRAAGLIQILLLFANPLVIILLIASAVSAFVGEIVNASIIALMVVVSIVINFFQTWHSQRAAERLRGQVAPTATILRDGKWTELPWREVVPGDVFRISAGDLVPADARLLQTKDLHVNQAALTGESLPVEKEASEGVAGVEIAAENSANASNAVFLGTSIVSGTATALVIATGPATAFGDIAARLSARPPETEFERGTKQFGYLIMKTILFLVFFVLLVSIALRHNPLESLLFALALAVGLTPEFLPMITTVTLGRGALHMARQKVIVKHLEAIQNFGSMDVLCSDKTGTLTSGEMKLGLHVDALGNPSEHVLLLGYINSTYDSGVRNPINAAILQHDPGQPEPLDISGYHKLDEIPFDFERRRLSVVTEAKGEILLITKGAPESVLTCCTQYEVNGQAHPLDSDARGKCQAVYDGLSSNGYRVLAVAFRPVPQQEIYRRVDEKDLVLAGFLAFSDPPLADAAESLEALRRDGVRVKILTGDSELVAQHVCSQVGLDPKHIVLGDELNHMSDSALAAVAEKAIVFARVSPVQKHRIILALKGRGHVVGYLGDGINDAPSLHAADVGISVATAVDVAKEAADIILLERSLRVLHQGILEGRKAFGNVMKYLLMGTSSNFGNMFSMAAAAMFLPFLPMLPTQILLNNFLYDLAQITIPTDNVDASYIDKPRRWDIRMIRDFMIYIGPISSIYDFLTFYALLKVFHASEAFFHTGWFVESLATQTLVLFVIRTASNPFRSRPSLPLAITTMLIVIVGIVLPFSPLADVFGFAPLPAMFFLFLGGAVVTYLLLVELVKRRLMGRRQHIRGRPSRLR
ncbi:MAG TPA: magnesium-translocating P-type ATPase [Blastocatellia bacterium]|nr:magnesium-translocating P-type ATPase [Blastocatellia bacterium]